jgi:hypothetical protein
VILEISRVICQDKRVEKHPWVNENLSQPGENNTVLTNSMDQKKKSEIAGTANIIPK